MAAIVLAGGRAERFGGAKLAADLDGTPILEHAIRAVRGISDEVVVAGGIEGRDLRPSLDDVRVLPDAEPFGGPLAALAGALAASEAELALVVGGDMPSLQPAVLRAMLDRLAADAAIDASILEAPGAGSDAPPQVLPLALRVAPARVAAVEGLASGRRSLQRLLDDLRVQTIPADAWLALDPTGQTLVDIDRPEDLERLR